MSLALRYKLDEGTGTAAEDDVGALDGVVSVSAAWLDTDPAPIGASNPYSLSVPTADFAITAADVGDDLLTDTSRSISFWLKVGSDQTGFGYAYACDLSGAALLYSPDEAFFGTGWFWEDGDAQRVMPDVLTPDEWHHVALVRTADGDNGSFWIDGVEQDFAGAIGDVPGSLGGIYLGQALGTGPEIDDIRIYDHALSPEEIEALAGIPPSIAGTCDVTTTAVTCDAEGLFAEYIEAEVDLSTAAASSEAEGEFTAPPAAGDAALTTAAATCSASGTFTAPVYSGTASLSTSAATINAGGAHTAPVYSGSAALAMSPTTAASSGSCTAPIYTGAAALSKSATTVSAAGSAALPIYTGTAAIVCSPVTHMGVGNFADPPTEHCYLEVSDSVEHHVTGSDAVSWVVAASDEGDP